MFGNDLAVDATARMFGGELIAHLGQLQVAHAQVDLCQDEQVYDLKLLQSWQGANKESQPLNIAIETKLRLTFIAQF